MTRQPKRRPGERNLGPDAEAPMRAVRESEVASGQGSYGAVGGLSIGRAVLAFLEWRKGRRNRRLR